MRQASVVRIPRPAPRNSPPYHNSDQVQVRVVDARTRQQGNGRKIRRERQEAEIGGRNEQEYPDQHSLPSGGHGNLRLRPSPMTVLSRTRVQESASHHGREGEKEPTHRWPTVCDHAAFHNGPL